MSIDTLYAKQAFSASRRFYCRQAVGCLLRRPLEMVVKRQWINDIICLWPPVNEGKIKDLNLIASVRFYAGDLSSKACIFIERPNRSLELRSISGQLIEDNVSLDSALNYFRSARYRVVHHGTPLARLPFRGNIFNVDETRGHSTVHEWLRLSQAMFGSEFYRENLWQAPKVDAISYIVGSGPSLSDFRRLSIDGLWLGANSIVIDYELCASTPPYAICMIDPHLFSPLPTMEELRQALYRLMKKFGTLLITTSEFAGVIQAIFPKDVQKFVRFVISLGLDALRGPVVDSARRVAVHRFGNVLCDIMLPCAGAMSNRVHIYGCDGRPPGAVGNYPKDKNLQVHEEAHGRDVQGMYSNEWYDSELNRIDMHTLYSRSRCERAGANFYVCRPSWNKGLSALPLIGSS